MMVVLGNPNNPHGYATSHLWKEALQKNSLLDILQKFIHLEVKEETKLDSKGIEGKREEEPHNIPLRYHQLDVVRKDCSGMSSNRIEQQLLDSAFCGIGEVEQYCLDSVSICLAV